MKLKQNNQRNAEHISC